METITYDIIGTMQLGMSYMEGKEDLFKELREKFKSTFLVSLQIS